MSDTTETLLWRGRPSHLTAAIVYLLAITMAGAVLYLKIRSPELPGRWVAAGLTVAAGLALIQWMSVWCWRYQLTSERLMIASGILVRRVDEVELYRVKDSVVLQPLWCRPLNLGTVVLLTSDTSTPVIHLRAIVDPEAVRSLVRQHVEASRMRKGVREIDI